MIRNEPVLSAASVSAVIIALASAFHVVLDTGLVETAVAAILPLVFAAIARHYATPAT